MFFLDIDVDVGLHVAGSSFNIRKMDWRRFHHNLMKNKGGYVSGDGNDKRGCDQHGHDWWGGGGGWTHIYK